MDAKQTPLTNRMLVEILLTLIPEALVETYQENLSIYPGDSKVYFAQLYDVNVYFNPQTNKIQIG